MAFTGLRVLRLIVVAAAIEMFQGLSIYAFPAEYTAAIYAPLRPYFHYLAAGLLTGGVTLLTLAQYPHPRWWRRLLSLFAVGPLAVLLGLFLAVRGWTAIIIYGSMVPALLVALWWPSWNLEPGAADRLDLASLTMGLMQLAIGTLALVAPSYLSALPGPTDQLLPLIGLSGLTGGAILLFHAYRRRDTRRFWVHVVTAILPAFLAFDYLFNGFYTGFFSWGVWTVAMLIGRNPVLWRWWQPLRPSEAETDPDPLPARLERVLESWLWLMAIGVTVLTAVAGPGQIASPGVAAFFVIAVSAYNLVAYRMARGVGTPEQRLNWHLIFMTLVTGILVSDQGPVGHAILAPFLLTIPLAARISGSAAGYRVIAVALIMALLGPAYGVWQGRETLQSGFWHASLQLLGILGAAVVGIQSSVMQRNITLALAKTRSDLARQVRQMGLVERIGSAVRGSLDLSAILQTAVDELGQALGVARCHIRLTHGGVLEPPAHSYVASGVEPLPPGFRLQGLAATLRQTGQIIVVGNVATDPIFHGEQETERAALLECSVHAICLAPLLAGDEMLGILSFHRSSPHSWTDEEVGFIRAVAGEAAVAIAHGYAHQTVAHSLAELQSAHEELQAAHEELQARDEEMVAQQEELQAQHEELIHQAESLQQQQAELEEALAQARAAEAAKSQFAEILEATPDLVAISDMSGRRLFMNRAGRRLIGFGDDEDIDGKALTEVHPPWARDLLTEIGIPTALREGMWRGESAYLTRDGREVPVSQVIVVHRGTDGEARFMSTVARDMTQWKQAQEALRDSEERFRSSFDSAPIGMALCSPDGTPLQVNQALCDMLGYSESELLAMSGEQLIHPEDRLLAREPMQQLLGGEIRAFRIERRYIHKQGYVITAELSVSLVRDGSGSPRYLLLQLNDITDRKQFESQLIHMANFDPLTDMFNRRRFEEALEYQLQLSRRYHTTGALLFLDLDQFKYVNDSLGHQAGDLFLKGLSAMLRQRLRKSDIIARLGGDEFAILLPNTDLIQAQSVADEIRKAVRRYTQVINSRPVSTTCSIGIALFPEHGTSPEELLSRADLAMYQAKEHGRNRCYVCTPEAEAENAASKLTWERRVREALEQDRLILYRQPIVDLKTGQTVQYELLLRMQNENGEIVLPKVFLDVAERFGQIRAIDRWVVRKAIRLIDIWRKTDPTICLEVNLSGRSFDDPELLPLIETELVTTGIDPKSLVLEITETAAIANIETARKFITRLQRLGCRFAIDDFGSGFSSFYYLKHLPVNYLKIDGNFIQNLPNDPVDQHLVRAMVEVAKGLGLKTVAEFVEQADTVEILKRLGIDYAQGFHIGVPAPMPPECEENS